MSLDQLVPKSIRTWVNLYLRQLVPRSTRTQVTTRAQVDCGKIYWVQVDLNRS